MRFRSREGSPRLFCSHEHEYIRELRNIRELHTWYYSLGWLLGLPPWLHGLVAATSWAWVLARMGQPRLCFMGVSGCSRAESEPPGGSVCVRSPVGPAAGGHGRLGGSLWCGSRRMPWKCPKEALRKLGNQCGTRTRLVWYTVRPIANCQADEKGAVQPRTPSFGACLWYCKCGIPFLSPLYRRGEYT